MMFEKLHFQECTVKLLPLRLLISKKRVQYHIKIDISKVSALLVGIGTKIVFLLLHLNNRSSKTFKLCITRIPLHLKVHIHPKNTHMMYI